MILCFVFSCDTIMTLQHSERERKQEASCPSVHPSLCSAVLRVQVEADVDSLKPIKCKYHHLSASLTVMMVNKP